MFPGSKHRTVRNTQSRRKHTQSRSHRSQKPSKLVRQSETAKLSFADRFRTLLLDIQRLRSRFLSYTVSELEEICEQLAIQQMSASATAVPSSESCVLICHFCQNLIFEPITLSCGHTYCDPCIKDEQISSSVNCPRCPDDIQGQIQSSIISAREKHFSRNHFLMQIFERAEPFKHKYPLIALYYKGKTDFTNGNHQQAVDTLSEIIVQDPEHHLAFYGRAKALAALEQFEPALADATRTVELKPQWTKGHLCRSEILFEMKQFTNALMSSMKALVIDPEDPFAKPIMARHLHAVLHNTDNQEPPSTTEPESEHPESMETLPATSSATTVDRPLTICQSIQSPARPCLCSDIHLGNLSSRDFECSICVSLLWFPITTPCGHVFCRECLIRSIDNNQIQCPMCKSSVEEFFPLVIEFHINKTEIIAKFIETYFPTEFEERRQLHEQENNQNTSLPQVVINDNAEATTTTMEIPIFVCVLALPSCVCPLHVFEPRYRLMMRRTIETESRVFGMCTYDDQADNFSDYGTLLYIRSLVYTQDGRSIVDTIGQRRFRVLERGTRDGYSTAKVQLIRDQTIEQHEFDDLFQLNRTSYNRVRNWFNHLDAYRRTLIAHQLEGYPACDDLVQGSTDGPSWSWIMLNLLPIHSLLQYTALASQSFRIRLQMINDVMDFLSPPEAATPPSPNAQ